MYLPRSLLSSLYLQLQRSRHPLSPPVLILVALEPDALCACRILTRMLKHDYIQHKIQPIAGYSDLEKAGSDLVVPMMQSKGGNGGVVICLGVGGMADMGSILGLEPEDDDDVYSGVEVWLLDSHRPWNLSNVFGGYPSEPLPTDAPGTQRPPPGVENGKITTKYRSGRGGIIAFDDGDIEDLLQEEQEAYTTLIGMPEIEETEDLGNSDSDSDEDEDELMPLVHAGQKRKAPDVQFDDDSDDDDDISDRPKQRRRSNSSTPIPQLPTGRGLMVAQSTSQNSAVVDINPYEPPVSAQPRKGPSPRALKRRLLRMRDDKESIIRKYYKMGSSFSDPISSTMYALASELGREDNDMLWLCIVGMTSTELYGRSSAGIAAPVRGNDRVASGWLGIRGARIRQILRDEVRRLNPPDVYSSTAAPEERGIIPTTARSPDDNGIRLSPEPKFLLIRHWSLYDSMLHSPYLFSRLRTWSDPGIKRLHKLLAKMGVSLVQCRQSYVHMDHALKRDLRQKLLKYASLYNLEEMVPSLDTDGKDRAGAKDGWGFVRSWGWRATLSAQDVVVIIGALLEVGSDHAKEAEEYYSGSQVMEEDVNGEARVDEWITQFWQAYDALDNIDALKAGLSTAQYLHRAIYRTGTSLINKRQIKHLKAFRLFVVKEGADVSLFTHPAALTKLALWIGEALTEQERDQLGKLSHNGRGTPLVAASLDEKRGVYTVVGTGGGGGPDTAFLNREAARKRREEREKKAKVKEAAREAKARVRAEKKATRAAARAKAAAAENNDGNDDDDDDNDDDDELETESEGSDSESDESDEDEDDVEASQQKGYGLNRFGAAFQEVIAETNARVRVDSFEHCVVEVKKEDLGSFLETLSMKTVVG
ncbi:hypothetical protein TD95_005403 [Thielaviopsis punctulata]|uniref:CDC45-like protein n=1 Tax=Thielaviopsis punctulata TaxID=72032 RepID=A0A0F4ZC48_9PEZI|nr:hypothetical protein TD95_005403 [Thielaviopsis punctulata]